MDRLNRDGRVAAAAQLAALVQSADDNATRKDDHDRLEPALEQARRLLARLGSNFTALASQTRASEAAQVWIETWARNIYANQLTELELSRGLRDLPQVMQAAGNPPFSFPHFLQACRPHQHLTGQDVEARQRHPLMLTRDRTIDAGWCSARDQALAKMRGMGYCKPNFLNTFPEFSED